MVSEVSPYGVEVIPSKTESVETYIIRLQELARILVRSACKVLALSGGSQPSSTAEQTQLDTAPAPSAGKSSPPPKADDDDNLDFFQKLADED